MATVCALSGWRGWPALGCKNLSGTRIRLREVHASGRLVFQQEWSDAAGLGLVRSLGLIGKPLRRRCAKPWPSVLADLARALLPLLEATPQHTQLDAAALALPVVQQVLAQGHTDLLQQQGDGALRFESQPAHRADLKAAGADLALPQD